MKLLLASQSPRRKQLLQELGFDFTTVNIDCEEIVPDNFDVENVAAYLSKLKSEAYQNLQQDEVLLTADTIVICNGQILGKPKNELEATGMLEKLSDNHHFVHTAFTLKNSTKILTINDIAKVYLKKLNTSEIDRYIKTYKPFDKAGAYGIQEWIGMAKIEKIEGSFYTIMGLPTHLLYDALQEFSINLE
ncbi:Maf family protein [Frigoriflavimonas asaccharolytica]|uniref:dTTP/UTP pyrophosphatase n=1 Tax=Frigoriflavimonas asaccharolytica TaxID=2735899 RepID=A0A8J8G744_9FLAO|nr:Maf family nucleotide pyrophosphatase [Frigoriflavimonas asaccharolytica]NRS91197.1 septum formation protein [Frigoriflavimonas asaccharolytica]